MRPRIVMAPDSFKGSATAFEVATRLKAGWLSVRPGDDCVCIPLADGGEGTIDALANTLAGARRMAVDVTGPDGPRHAASWLLLADGTGVVELASTSGITLLDHLDPMGSHTVGFGEAIADALAHPVDELWLALGGSASSDGGTGMLTALGGRVLDSGGRSVPAGARGLDAIRSVDLTGLPPLPRRGARILSDVGVPLRGPSGAARLFARQKGADDDQIEWIEQAMSTLVRHAPGGERAASLPGSGAAGGTGFGLALWGGEFVSGADSVTDAVRLRERIAEADLVVAGEGRFDAQSTVGKIVGHVLQMAEEAGRPSALVAGSIEGPVRTTLRPVELRSLAGSVESAMRCAGPLLEEAGRTLARNFSANSCVAGSRHAR